MHTHLSLSACFSNVSTDPCDFDSSPCVWALTSLECANYLPTQKQGLRRCRKSRKGGGGISATQPVICFSDHGGCKEVMRKLMGTQKGNCDVQVRGFNPQSCESFGNARRSGGRNCAQKMGAKLTDPTAFMCVRCGGGLCCRCAFPPAALNSLPPVALNLFPPVVLQRSHRWR